MSKIIDLLAEIVINKETEINDWFNDYYSKTTPFFYSSVDLRHSGNKLVPVDTNLFPAGFNLLSYDARKLAVKYAGNYFKQYHPQAKKVLLIPENHTRNLYYLENVANIREILQNCGLTVQIGNLVTQETIELHSASGSKLIIEPIIRDKNKIRLNGFEPDIILVNNDLSSGAPEILTNLEQPVIPPIGMGWYRRRKTSHFDSYAEIARKFADEFGFDEWLISSTFNKCGTINFKERKGLECVARNVAKTLHLIENKYKEYGIEQEPYVFIKADSGTYGMGIMTVKSPEEVMEINKKSRNKMTAIKEGVINEEVIIQEGIPTIDMVDGKVAEPMIYLIDGEPIGCTMRVNENRDDKSNLNSAGMTFQNACNDDSETEDSEKNNICPVRGLIARLASLAATRECYEGNWEI